MDNPLPLQLPLPLPLQPQVVGRPQGETGNGNDDFNDEDIYDDFGGQGRTIEQLTIDEVTERSTIYYYY